VRISRRVTDPFPRQRGGVRIRLDRPLFFGRFPCRFPCSMLVSMVEVDEDGNPASQVLCC
jgi:hypothetical protein